MNTEFAGNFRGLTNFTSNLSRGFLGLGTLCTLNNLPDAIFCNRLYAHDTSGQSLQCFDMTDRMPVCAAATSSR